MPELASRVGEADTNVTTNWKWRGIPMWYHAWTVCTSETYNNVVTMTFAKLKALTRAAVALNISSSW